MTSLRTFGDIARNFRTISCTITSFILRIAGADWPLRLGACDSPFPKAASRAALRGTGRSEKIKGRNFESPTGLQF